MRPERRYCQGLLGESGVLQYTGVGSAAAAAKSLQSCPTVRPHRWQPTRLPRLWHSPSKNTGVGCHFLLQCMKVKSESEVAQSYPTLGDPMDCSLPGSSSMGFSRQEYWSGVPLPSPTRAFTSPEVLAVSMNKTITSSLPQTYSDGFA